MKSKILFFFFFTISIINSQDLSSMDESAAFALNKISVTIGGDFISNGTFPAFATERVDEFVTRIYNQYRIALLTTTKDARSLAQLKTEIDEYAERGVILKHIDGSEQKVDLKKFRLTADFQENPYLLNGDVLVFPRLDWQRNFIEVEGAVNKPITFQFVEGDKVSDALLFSRGINPAYDNIKGIEITRLSYDGMSEEIIAISQEDNIELQRGDRVRVVADETQKRDFKVLIGGEVNKPGYIFITKDQTTIKEVIEKAGGFKANADLLNGEIIRGNVLSQTSRSANAPWQDRRRPFDLMAFNANIDLLMMNRMADIEVEDSLSLIQDNVLRNARAGVTIDFRQVLNDSSSDSKFIVKDGDLIYVPEISDLVYVYGQVMNPGYIDYVDSVDYDYYISKSGGIGNRAKDEVYLIKSKTRAWIDMTDDEHEYVIESGDYIWVPKDIPRNFDYYLARTARIAAVIGAVATVILLFK